jgi:3-hydroxyacyl-[acyl-carrier-protein] dehydratase
MLDVREIMQIIPHRYPMLLIDRVIEMEPGVRIVGEKLVSVNEPFFAGHFPEQPIMPGVFIIESLAQVGAVGLLSMPDYRGKMAYFAGIDQARFRRQVVPGDVLRLEVTFDKLRRGIGKSNTRATVGDQLACEATIMFAIGDRT